MIPTDNTLQIESQCSHFVLALKSSDRSTILRDASNELLNAHISLIDSHCYDGYPGSLGKCSNDSCRFDFKGTVWHTFFQNGISDFVYGQELDWNSYVLLVLFQVPRCFSLCTHYFAATYRLACLTGSLDFDNISIEGLNGNNSKGLISWMWPELAQWHALLTRRVFEWVGENSYFLTKKNKQTKNNNPPQKQTNKRPPPPTKTKQHPPQKNTGCVLNV